MGIISFEIPPNLRRRLVGTVLSFFFFLKYQLEALDFSLWEKKEGREKRTVSQPCIGGWLCRAEVRELPRAF